MHEDAISAKEPVSGRCASADNVGQIVNRRVPPKKVTVFTADVDVAYALLNLTEVPGPRVDDAKIIRIQATTSTCSFNEAVGAAGAKTLYT